jgi:phosphoglycolate phosphatase
VDQGRRLRARAHLPRGDRPPRRRAGGAATSDQPLTVFFDFDGTLVDVRERHYQTYREATERFGGRPLDGGRYWKLKRRSTPWPAILAESGVATRFHGAFLERFVASVEAPSSLRLDRLYPGVGVVLRSLRERGDHLVLLSLRRSSGSFLQQVHDLGVAGLFERICSGHAKPAGHLDKIELIRQVGFSPPAVVVGDTEADVLAARALGLAAIAVSTGLRSRSYLQRAGADVVLDGVRQVPAALRPVRAWMPPRPPGPPCRPRG